MIAILVSFFCYHNFSVSITYVRISKIHEQWLQGVLNYKKDWSTSVSVSDSCVVAIGSCYTSIWKLLYSVVWL